MPTDNKKETTVIERGQSLSNKINPPIIQELPHEQDAFKAYQRIINRCAELKLDMPLTNGHADHAAVIIEAFFEHAQEELNIFTGELYDGVFSRQTIITAALKFLGRRRENKLNIAFQHAISNEDFLGKKFVSAIIGEDKSNNCTQVRIFDASRSQKGYHFCVMDKTAFRRELNHSERSAIANFGAQSLAEELYQEFKRITRDAAEIFPCPSSSSISCPS